MKIGDVYWTIRPVIESENYGEQPPHLPWKGVISHIQGAKDLSIWLSAIKPDGGPDDDPNATAIVCASDLFLTRPEAMIAYKAHTINYLRAELIRLAEMVNTLV